MYDYGNRMSYKSSTLKRRKAITVRVPERLLRRLMRARKSNNQSDLINALLAEEEERQRSWRAIQDTIGTGRPSEIDDRLL